jgi:ubiquitin C-terminal hydrolase
MPKRKFSNSNDSDEEKEEKENSKLKKSGIKDDSYSIKLSKKDKNNEKEEGENISEKSNPFSLFFNKKNNENQEDVKSLKDEIQKLKNDNKEKDKVIEKLTYELSGIKKNFSEFNKKMRFKEDEIQLLNSEYEKLLKEHDILQKQFLELISKKDNNLPQINKNINNPNNIINQNNNFNNQINIGSINNNNNFINVNNKNINNKIIRNNNQINNNNFINNINQIPIGQENFLEIKLKPIQKYSKPTLIGLQNVGATCFMNSTLQCLSQTKGLTNYFLDEKNKQTILNNNIAKKNPNEYQLSPVYLELIQNLWKDKGPKYYAPYNFMNRVNAMNPLFQKGQAGDAKDFIIFVLEQMHRELKKPLNLNNINENLPINQYDKKLTLMNFFNEFTKETSVLSDLFFGFNETTNVCLHCKYNYNSQNKPNPICYNYGIFNVLIFPLEEVKKMKNNMNLMNFQNFYQGPSNIVSIDDCFIYNQKTDLFTGENKNYCNICKQLSDSNYTSKIYISPNVLVLILNRGKGNIFKVKMDFKETIDISNYIIQKEKPRIMYNLYGVITHIGESGPNAHFVASCKSPVDGKWYRYNDAIVTSIDNFQKEIYDYCVPYILFYEKVQ